jgi:hypothetical protein
MMARNINLPLMKLIFEGIPIRARIAKGLGEGSRPQ